MILLHLLDVNMLRYSILCTCCTEVVCTIVYNHEIIQWLQCDNKIDLKFLNVAWAIPPKAILLICKLPIKISLFQYAQVVATCNSHRRTHTSDCFSFGWIFQHLVLCCVIGIDFKFKLMQKLLMELSVFILIQGLRQ